jgi:ureidoacrylate peracid hydrolase
LDTTRRSRETRVRDDVGHLGAPERLRFAADRAAVVVIDAQNDFCHPDGLLARQGRDVERIEPALRSLEVFLGSAREAGVPVVFVQNIHDPGSDSAAWLSRHVDVGRAQSCQSGTWGAEFCRVAPEPQDHVVTKHRYSAFIGTELLPLLHRLGRPSLLFTGFTTSVCVESSLRDAVCHDFLATLVEDCCGAYSERPHRRAIESVQLGFGVVATSDRVVSAWRSDEPDRDPTAVSPSVISAAEVAG